MLDGIIRTSVLLGALLAASPIQADERSVLRVREDAQRDRLWVLRPNGLHLYSLKTRQLLRHIALPGWYWAGEPYSCAPDVAIGPHGEALVTSDVAPVLWRVDPRSLTVGVRELALDADNHMDVGFTGLVYAPQHSAYLAVSYAGSLWRIDTGLSQARKIPLSAPLAQACGISVRPTLCVRGEDKDWVIELAPDARSGRVSPTPLCARPGEGSVAGNGRSTAR
jgi:hypothetical protein